MPRAASRAPVASLKADLMFGEVNESVKAYGIGGHRHVAEIEQELGGAVGAAAVGAPIRAARGRLPPHLIPMTRGILSAGHVRPTPADHPGRARRAVRERPTPTSRSCTVVVDAAGDQADAGQQPRAGSTSARTSGPAGSSPSASMDNLVKGAAGQAIQAFNLVHGLPETTGLEQLPLAPD